MEEKSFQQVRSYSSGTNPIRLFSKRTQEIMLSRGNTPDHLVLAMAMVVASTMLFFKLESNEDAVLYRDPKATSSNRQ